MSAEIENAWIAGDKGAGWWDYLKEFYQAELMTPSEAYKKTVPGFDGDGNPIDFPIIDWGVDLVPVKYRGEETPYNLIVRDVDEKVLNCVGPQFTPIQNDRLMQIVQQLTDAGEDLGVDSVMSLKEGKVVVICARRPEAVQIAGEDHLQHIVAANWHGGQARSAVVYFSDIRAECANTLHFGMSGAKNLYRFRHVGDVDIRIEEAREVLQMSFKYHEQLVEVGNQLAKVPMTEREFDAFLKKAYPINDSTEKSEVTRLMNTREGIKRVYQDEPDLQNLTMSPWRALQANAAYFEHQINYQSGDNRFLAGISQDTNQRAFAVLADFAGIKA